MGLLTALIFCVALRQNPMGGVATFGVTPSTTDPDIVNFNDAHWIYVNRSILIAHDPSLPADRHQLLLWLTGTGGKGHDAQAFLALGANLGYRCINLMYDDQVPASTCAYDRNPTAFEDFRAAIIQGGVAAAKAGRDAIQVSRAESIVNRLTKLLVHLQRIRPREQWSQFLDRDGTIDWSRIAVAGQSQGGGHAALIGIKKRVARVICFGAPKDYSQRLHSPAAYYSELSATPRTRFFAFNHVQDPMGCTPEELWANLQTFEGEAFGKPAQVDQEEFPYRHQHVLYTAYPVANVTGVESAGALAAHTSGIDGRNAERWKQVWTYLLDRANALGTLKTMPLYHFSEDPTIERFVPRPPLAHPTKEARIWTIDEWHSPLYFLPSDCPRATFWPVQDTTDDDRQLYWPDKKVRMVIAIEHAWLERFLTTKIYRYALPPETFVPCGGDYGAHVSEAILTPLRVEPVGPLWQAMANHDVDFRVMPSLRAFAHKLMATTFHWSFIRMRNAIDWDLPAGEPVMPAPRQPSERA